MIPQKRSNSSPSRPWKRAIASAGDESAAPRTRSAKEGDANADGSTDISDAVTILGNLFLGNPKELSPLCSSRANNPGLPDTSQVTCSDEEGLDIACDSAACHGQDGSYATGCESNERFVDNGDGTVTDNCTGLIWQKRTADTNGDGKIGGGDAVDWCDALVYCESLSLAGHDDWRLPNVRELQSIVSFRQACMNPLAARLRWAPMEAPSPTRRPAFRRAALRRRITA